MFGKMMSGKNTPLIVALALGLSGVIVFRLFLKWDAIGLTVKMEDLPGLLSPLAFAAAIVERAVEILVSPWRDAEASKLDKALAAVMARPVSLDPAIKAANDRDQQTASDALDEYRGETQRLAFGISLTLSTLLSMAGVRALGRFADQAALKNSALTSPDQHMFFLCVDVALTATLLAGGADGIHSLVNAVTSFFDATAAKTSASGT